MDVYRINFIRNRSLDFLFAIPNDTPSPARSAGEGKICNSFRAQASPVKKLKCILSEFDLQIELFKSLCLHPKKLLPRINTLRGEERGGGLHLEFLKIFPVGRMGMMWVQWRGRKHRLVSIPCR